MNISIVRKDTPVLPPDDPVMSSLLRLNQLHAAGHKLTHDETLRIIADARSKSETDATLERFVTAHPLLLRLKQDVRAIAPLSDSVFITGPSGTGKEILARALHGSRHGQFIGTNCGGISRELICSHFFGHIKGAFTGATSDRTGILVAAEDGTVFLDEIAEMPYDLQATLLRAIEEQVVYPVGSTTPIPINCRFVSATMQDIATRIETGAFRQDLYARLSAFELSTMPLAARPDDIPLIAASLGWTEPITPEGMTLIYRDNVRGLKNYIRRMRVLGHI